MKLQTGLPIASMQVAVCAPQVDFKKSTCEQPHITHQARGACTCSCTGKAPEHPAHSRRACQQPHMHVCTRATYDGFVKVHTHATHKDSPRKHAWPSIGEHTTFLETVMKASGSLVSNNALHTIICVRGCKCCQHCTRAHPWWRNHL